MLETIYAESSVPSVACRWCWMSRTVILVACRLMITFRHIVEAPLALPDQCGVKMPFRSRGLAGSMPPSLAGPPPGLQ